MIDSIYSTQINVRDIDAALDFYTKTLGFETEMDQTFPDGFRWVTVRPPGAATCLSLNHNPEARPDPRGSGINFVAKDVDKFYETVSAKGVVFDGPPEMMPWGSKGTTFSDPDGNKFFVG